MKRPLVALVGRPNVGKSALFNRLTGRRIAIVEDTPGVTRDRIYAPCTWGDTSFSLIDTGGLGTNTGKLFDSVTEQTQVAIQEATLILFVFDVQKGILPLDETILQQLYKSTKPVILVVNKVDTPTKPQQLADFFALGKPFFTVSAEHGLGIGDLLEGIIRDLPETPPEPEPDSGLKIALIGRPNVGKSSLVNCFLGEDRSLVYDQPGTTRDAVDIPFHITDQPALLIDTAGIRRKGKVKHVLEKYSVIKALQSIDRADVCLLVLDVSEGITEQDTKLAGYIHSAGKACLVVLNKCDLFNSQLSDISSENCVTYIKGKLKFMPYAPIILTSALQGQGIKKILKNCLAVFEQAHKQIPTSKLNQVLQNIIIKHPPASYKGKEMKIFYATQSGKFPPTFTLFVNNPDGLHFTYLRYLNNQFRRAFGFRGTPIKIIIRRRRH